MKYVLVPVLVMLAGCGTLSTAPTLTPGRSFVESEEAQQELRRHVYTLASEEFEGREAGSAGERQAAEYIAEELERAGVLPGARAGEERSYFQPFDLHVTAFDTAHTLVHFHGMEPIDLGEEWIAFPDQTPTVIMDSLEVVFAGYGIAAPAQGHDDFDGLDVEGRLVVALAGAPPTMDSIQTFSGPFAAGDFLIKWISAVQRGAAALVVVGEEDALEAWSDYATLATTSAMRPVGEETYVPIMPYIFVSDEFGRLLLQAMEAEGEEQAFHTDRWVDLSLIPRMSTATSQNVVGVLPGSASDGEEYVALGAHYDHLGVSADGVFQGADDNASGVAALLLVARALAMEAADNEPVDRSMLFVFHGAEEKGLLGAEHFVGHPEQSVVDSLSQIAAHVNLDMVGREDPDTLYVTGAYMMSSELGELVDAANRDAESFRPFAFNREYDDPDDPERIFERSDHIAYARSGIPVVFFTDGMGANWRKDTAADDYHEVSDSPDKIDFDKLVRVSRLVFEIGRRAGNASVRFDIDGVIPEE